jgi:branched-chain amino acid transport system ATP-binding protein
MEIVARYVTRIIAFDSGEIIADGPPRSVLGNARVQEFVVGHHLDASAVAGETA